MIVPPADDLSGPGPRAGDRPVILLVEDEVLVRMDMAWQLRSDGMAVIEATNADEAMAVLDSGAPIELMVTDVRMPGTIDGLGLSRLVRARFPQMKVVVVSGDDLTLSGNGQVADAFVRKPHDAGDLTRLIRKLLELQRDH